MPAPVRPASMAARSLRHSLPSHLTPAPVSYLHPSPFILKIRRQPVRLVSSRASSTSKRPPPPSPQFPTVAACPSPTCACEPMPELPEGLPIDHKAPLNGLISAYNEQVLVCTGHADWPSKIEEENSGDNLAADLKELFGRGGKYSDPFHNVSVLNSSFPASPPSYPGLQSSSVYLLPSFTYVPMLPRVSFDAVEALAKGFLLPERLHKAHDGLLSPVHRDRLTRKAPFQGLLPNVQPVTDILVLICGHGGRDARCGIMGPVLEAAFEGQLERVGVAVQHGPIEVGPGPARLADKTDEEADPSRSVVFHKSEKTARIGMISHIGGHKFAGNVIIYLPPNLAQADGSAHPLAGYGVWYGRIEPQHVEGIVKETVLDGRVVTDHFRGAISPDRKIVRL
ncbi:fmi1 protein [Ophiostoma piceae UAMH 11346]|uniref:Altered inheritance of mitochondria protein 32 n=1 Tax=Ophiostoma piceae (strain UAMH 11346) TaxID=1262450 RepID=S3CNY9_OPHP1|nr:fmi1 protein [Ophiostoma piceae UAMH 11346]